MATFELTGPDGGTYHVDAPDVNSAVAAFSAFHGVKAATAPPPDKYQQAALDERAGMLASGAPMQEGVTRRLIHGATFGADSTLTAAALTPFEMIKRGTLDPREAYNYTKAREDLTMDKARENTGALGIAAEIAGGALSGGALAKAGISSAAVLPQATSAAGKFARGVGVSSLDAGGLGAVSGAMEGNGLQERATNALKGGATGLALGAALPVVIGGAKVMGAPLINNIKARIDPQGYGDSQIARGFHEGNLTPNDVSSRVIQAGNEGQGEYTVADALGVPGQRLLSTAARAPGPARTNIVDTMEARQAGQGRRVSNALQEGFGNPQTAAQTEAAMTGARDTAANAEYGAVRSGAAPVDVTGAIAHIDQTLGPAADQMLAHPGSVTANDGIEGILQGFRNRLARVNPEDFPSVQRIRGEMADAAQNAAQNGYGNRARLIRGAVGELDAAMENASAGHLAANRNFSQASRNIEAVDQGRNAAMRGRTEDTIPAFQALPAEGQQAFRAGYVDPLIAQTQGAAFGANKARPLSNEAFQTEAGVMAPGNDLMQRRLGREQTMFETRHHAMGGSPTSMNLNDDAAMGAAPELAGAIGHILTSNVGGAVRSILSAGSNWLKVGGNTPEVRQRVAEVLLQRAPNINPAALQAMVDQTVARLQKVSAIADSLRGAAGGALATMRPGQKVH